MIENLRIHNNDWASIKIMGCDANVIQRWIGNVWNAKSLIRNAVPWLLSRGRDSAKHKNGHAQKDGAHGKTRAELLIYVL